MSGLAESTTMSVSLPSPTLVPLPPGIVRLELSQGLVAPNWCRPPLHPVALSSRASATPAAEVRLDSVEKPTWLQAFRRRRTSGLGMPGDPLRAPDDDGPDRRWVDNVVVFSSGVFSLVRLPCQPKQQLGSSNAGAWRYLCEFVRRQNDELFDRGDRRRLEQLNFFTADPANHLQGRPALGDTGRS